MRACCTHGCQIAVARFLVRMCLALWASGLWLRYAMLQNMIPSFPWITPSRPPPWRNPRKGRDQILPSGNLVHRASQSADDGGALFQYGPRTGCRSFKVQMAKFLSHGYEDEVKEDNLGEEKLRFATCCFCIKRGCVSFARICGITHPNWHTYIFMLPTYATGLFLGYFTPRQCLLVGPPRDSG